MNACIKLVLQIFSWLLDFPLEFSLQARKYLNISQFYQRWSN